MWQNKFAIFKQTIITVVRHFIKIIGVIFLLGNHFSTYSQDSTQVIIYDLPPFDFDKWYTELDDSIKDIDGNFYHTIKLGEQIWMRENLKVSKYNDGKLIPLAQDSAEWTKTNKDAYTIYYKRNGDQRFFYNYKVVTDSSNVCPCGWRVPDSTDWQILENYAKEVNRDFSKGQGLIFFSENDTIHLRKEIIDIWASDIEGLSFSNQPYGYRSGITGEYLLIGSYGHWWSKSGIKVAMAWSRIFVDRGLGIDDIHLSEFVYRKRVYGFVENHGLSIRCIKE